MISAPRRYYSIEFTLDCITADRMSHVAILLKKKQNIKKEEKTVRKRFRRVFATAGTEDHCKTFRIRWRSQISHVPDTSWSPFIYTTVIRHPDTIS